MHSKETVLPWVSGNHPEQEKTALVLSQGFTEPRSLLSMTFLSQGHLLWAEIVDGCYLEKKYYR